MKSELFKYLKNQILEKGRESITDEMDAIGVGEYLPDIINDSVVKTEREENKKDENIPNEIKNFIFEENDTLEGKGIPESQESLFDKIETEGNFEDFDIINDSFVHKNKETETDLISDYKNTNGIEGDGKEKIEKIIQVKPQKLRLLVSDIQERKYRLNFSVNETINDAVIELYIAGEQGSNFLNIKEATNPFNKKLKFKENKIFINRLEKEKNYSVFFILNESENYSMEVIIYGSKI